MNHDYGTDDYSDTNANTSTPARSHANVDPGTYTARFARWHWDTSKKGDMCLAAMLRIVGGPFDGQQVRGTLYFDTDKVDKNGRTAADRSMEALRSAGLAGDLDAIELAGAAGGLFRGGLDGRQVAQRLVELAALAGHLRTQVVVRRGAALLGLRGELLRELFEAAVALVEPDQAP